MSRKYHPVVLKTCLCCPIPLALTFSTRLIYFSFSTRDIRVTRHSSHRHSNTNKLKPDPKKTNTLKDWPRTLTTVKEVRSVLGVLGYQRPFIPDYANIARPLVTLTKKDDPFTWSRECTTALNTLIDVVLANSSLRHPDLTRPFFLQVDASAFATGAILTQKDDRGKHLAVGFHSQTFNEAERNYDIHGIG